MDLRVMRFCTHILAAGCVVTCGTSQTLIPTDNVFIWWKENVCLFHEGYVEISRERLVGAYLLGRDMLPDAHYVEGQGAALYQTELKAELKGPAQLPEH